MLWRQPGRHHPHVGSFLQHIASVRGNTRLIIAHYCLPVQKQKTQLSQSSTVDAMVLCRWKKAPGDAPLPHSCMWYTKEKQAHRPA
ncbi:hypothetical protein ABEF95_001612 [Exophiala dermatitidis]